MHLPNVFLIPLWNFLPISFSTIPPSLLSTNTTLDTINRSISLLSSSPINNGIQKDLLPTKSSSSSSSSSLSNLHCNGVIVKVYRYHHMTNILTTYNCTIYHPVNCESKNLTIGLKNTPICHKPKVLFFGAIKRSDSNRRFYLCDVMTRNVKDFNCFEGVFGIYLDDLINHASIIALERYYHISSLESHRIDPLLLKGKILVSTKSFGKLIVVFIYLSLF